MTADKPTRSVNPQDVIKNLSNKISEQAITIAVLETRTADLEAQMAEKNSPEGLKAVKSQSK